jgi:hypothetical protein
MAKDIHDWNGLSGFFRDATMVKTKRMKLQAVGKMMKGRRSGVASMWQLPMTK